MLADYYIPRLSNDMKIAVQENHLDGQILYISLDPSKKRCTFLFYQNFLFRHSWCLKKFIWLPSNGWQYIINFGHHGNHFFHPQRSINNGIIFFVIHFIFFKFNVWTSKTNLEKYQQKNIFQKKKRFFLRYRDHNK